MRLSAAQRLSAARASQPTVDPFRKADLIFKAGAKGVTVYSVGPDGQDDGGLERTPQNAQKNHDLVTHLPSL